MKVFYTILILIFGLGITNSYSQVLSDSNKTEKKYYLVVKNDGSEYYGYIIKDDGREILLQTKNIGKIFINKSDIQELREVEESKKGNNSNLEEYNDLRENGPFTTRYYFTTNALPIKKKENYALIHLYGPEVHFAVSDNLSIGVMTTWIASPIALAVKYSFTNPNPDSDINFAIGGIVGSGGYLAPQAYGGLYFATVTKGDRSSNVSFSAGFAHVNLGANNSNGTSYSKYNYQTYDETQNNYVQPGYYPTNEDVIRTKNTSNNGSIVVGISGIKAVGKKASFIFDSMIFFTKRNQIEYNKEVSVNFTQTWDTSLPTNANFNVLEGSYVEGGYKPTIILMPGMRFNTGYGKAIQIVLSGAIFERTESDGSRGYVGIPIPQVSWLRAF